MNRLFRHTAIMVLAGALLLTGCAYDDAVRDMREHRNGSDSLAIEFNNGFIDNPVITRAVTLLSDHSNTMGVWGWQTTPDGAVERLFLNQEVTFNRLLGKWTYSPVKYWESHSNYRFCAYAPHDGGVDGTATIDPETLAISIKGVTLNGDNTIKDTGVYEAPANFSGVDDVDWMIDRSVQSIAGTYRNEVAFNMQHILSKLCVKVGRSSTFASDTVVRVVIDSIKIDDFIRQGNFTSNMTGTPYDISEWTPVDTLPRYSMRSVPGLSLPDTAIYVIESLFIPHTARTDQRVRVWYSIGNEGGFITRFHCVFNLSDMFSTFLPGRNYMITFTVSPDVITFDSGVSGWENQNLSSTIY